MATPEQLVTVTKHYLIALLWTAPGNDECENPGDAYDASDLPHAIYDQAYRDCEAFILACGALFDDAMACHADGYGQHPDVGSAEAAFGHDFALTRNGHGAGFWDRDSEGLPRVLGHQLTRIAESMGECNLLIESNGSIYYE